MPGIRSRDELVRRVDASWLVFAERVSRVTVDALAEPSAGGWTGKAMLAHIAAWHDATTYRLHRYVATRRPQPKVEDDDDRFNARVAEEIVDRPTDEVLDALYDSFRRFRSAIATLPPDVDTEGWVEAVVAANSYEHYAEHLDELERLGRG